MGVHLFLLHPNNELNVYMNVSSAGALIAACRNWNSRQMVMFRTQGTSGCKYFYCNAVL